VHRSRQGKGFYGKTFEGCGQQSYYEIITKVGVGTFGCVAAVVIRSFFFSTFSFREVHKAFHTSSRVTVALKRVLTHNEHEGMPVTALREIKILKALSHPNFSHACRPGSALHPSSEMLLLTIYYRQRRAPSIFHVHGLSLHGSRSCRTSGKRSCQAAAEPDQTIYEAQQHERRARRASRMGLISHDLTLPRGIRASRNLFDSRFRGPFRFRTRFWKSKADGPTR
jgi:hypothetical protein